ncbi:cell envelope biogenesis protein LolA [Pacificitalea manganoxidans]|uniref:Cell envelope biogenesis protein LolA n=1 Tax=Pacificitalea manganoxidans TaxID=1411902 RepID=A0A291M1J1_9RHOB|nr:MULTISPECIES: outer membrane lipoprotein carrier protein LolA [Paracoccaceae]MAQ46849.1 outer membrane lipoprotein carrier protein LolA [Actibacterium sp.]OWU68865.1 cell envelope biogenesis protein LolA [Roseovarius sp. 22II1-1F6A]ATI42764.1 cell envelope biogenesis protein LolA [Pacificitalea manganoxidans]MBF51403.1 outer membrane lipoprotein carrier protein LolA [Actibacterium sp.]MDR6307336.1 outer membrane lipoprotein-sorting protein [Pacificitalea manganoxidans]|tara:strand:- start:176 stop:778 length:603 start_codon:yes stop_codon:yes gene_type:complete
MKTLRILLIPALWLGLSLPALAQQLSLGAMSNYLNSFQTAQGEFTQINADGTISTGQLYLKRPGRMRFEYAAPDNSLVMAGGQQVAVFDGKSNTGPEQYPLSRTPLSIILAQNVDFSRSGMVTGHTSDGKTTTITAQDPAHPEYGNIQLKFTANPVELRQWIVTDDSGTKTTVVLGDLRKGVNLGSTMFNIVQETQRRGG